MASDVPGEAPVERRSAPTASQSDQFRALMLRELQAAYAGVERRLAEVLSEAEQIRGEVEQGRGETEQAHDHGTTAEPAALRLAADAIAQLRTLLRHEREAREALEAQQDRLINRVETLQAQLHDARAALKESVAAGAAVRRELESLWGSRSWRYTQTLRHGGLLVRAVLRRVTRAGDPPKAPDEAPSPARPDASAPPPLAASGARVLRELEEAIAERRR